MRAAWFEVSWKFHDGKSPMGDLPSLQNKCSFFWRNETIVVPLPKYNTRLNEKQTYNVETDIDLCVDDGNADKQC
jgi:hypothetical protein